jgi:hypothetical protein
MSRGRSRKSVAAEIQRTRARLFNLRLLVQSDRASYSQVEEYHRLMAKLKQHDSGPDPGPSGRN